MNRSNRKKIALLEDHEDSRDVLRLLLEDSFDVEEFENAQDLLNALEDRAYDAIIADVALPGIDGLSMIRLLRADARFRKLPVIAVTAYAKDSDREKGLSAGFTAYLTKPVESIDNIISCLEKHITQD